MKQFIFICLLIFTATACNLPFQKKEKCIDFVMDLSKKTKEWLNPMQAQAGKQMQFFNTKGDSLSVLVFISTFTNSTFISNNCSEKNTVAVINYWSNTSTTSGYYVNMSVLGMVQDVSIIPGSNFCDKDKLNTFNTQNETITKRAGLLNYQIINDFDFHGDKVMCLNGQFSLSADGCMSSSFPYSYVSTFWISQKYGLMQFKDFDNEIWTRKL